MKHEDLIAYVDGQMSPEQESSFEEELLSHPEFVEPLAELYRQRLMLEECFAVERKAARKTVVHAVRPPLRPVGAVARHWNDSSSGLMWRVMIPLVACVMFLFGGLYFYQHRIVLWAPQKTFSTPQAAPQSAQPVVSANNAEPAPAAPVKPAVAVKKAERKMIAFFSQADSTVEIIRDGAQQAVRTNMDILDQDTIVVHQRGVKICYKDEDATVMNVMPESRLKLTVSREGKRVALAHGTVLVEAIAQPPDKPMKVTGDFLSARVAGTRFVFTAKADRCRADTYQGMVKVIHPITGEGIDVPAGRYAEGRSNGLEGGDTLPTVTGFTLINADSGDAITGYDPMKDGAVLSLARLPTRHLNIRANTEPEVVDGSVDLGFDGRQTSLAPVAPYAVFGCDLAGADAGKYHVQSLAPGEHSVSAEPVPASKQPHSAIAPLKIGFSVAEQ